MPEFVSNAQVEAKLRARAQHGGGGRILRNHRTMLETPFGQGRGNAANASVPDGSVLADV
jgi:hypothetical protein